MPSIILKLFNLFKGSIAALFILWLGIAFLASALLLDILHGSSYDIGILIFMGVLLLLCGGIGLFRTFMAVLK